MKLKKSDYILIISLIVVIGTVYGFTLSRKVNLVDSGELSTVCETLGIAHPTGYPLYTLAGYAFSLLPFRQIMNTNIYSAFFAILAALFSFFLLKLLFKKLFPDLSDIAVSVSSFVTACLFAFSKSFWQTSVITEVYSLHTFLFICTTFLLIAWDYYKSKKLLYLFFFLFGLSFGNHMSMVLFVLPFGYFLLSSDFELIKSWKTVLSCAFLFVGGLSVYLYLPLRASTDPFWNWGNPNTWERFYRHVSGWQYRVWMFSRSFSELMGELKDYFFLLTTQYTYYLIPFALLGLVSLFVRKTKIFIFLLSIFAIDIIYSLNYSIPDIESYYIPSFFIMAILIGFGIISLIKWFNLSKLSLVSVVLIAPVMFLNWGYADMSEKNLAETTAKNLTAFVEENSLVILDNWDFFSPQLYLQQIEDRREDIIFVDYELLRRSWYVKSLLRKHPKVFEPAEEEMRAFAESVKAFEREKEYSSRELQSLFTGMINKFVMTNLPRRSVYTSFSRKPNFVPSLLKVPQGLLYKIRTGLNFTKVDYDSLNLQPVLNKKQIKTKRDSFIADYYKTLFRARSEKLFKTGKLELAQDCLRELSKFDKKSLRNLGKVYVQLGKYQSALEVYRRLISEFPQNKGKWNKMIDMIKRRMDARKPNTDSTQELKSGR